MIQAALYCRVSTSEQRDEGTSLDTQRDQGLVKAGELEWTVSQEHIIQEDWTGKDLQRPGLLRLLDLARSGEIRGIIIFTLDRLYRPENDGDEWRVFELLQQFNDAGVEVAWVDTSIPTQGPLASIFTFLDAWRAGRERRAMVERTTRGRLEKARRGFVVSRASAPFGYRFDPETSTLVIQAQEAKVVRLIFHLYTQERLSLIKLSDSLNRLGIPRPKRGNRWYISNLGRMLRNEAYAGTLWQNKWKQHMVTSAPGQRPKVKQAIRAKSEQIAVNVPAIITRDTFDSAQKRLEENLKLARRNTKREYLLSGLLRHSCGSRMRGRTNHDITYYHCKRKAKASAPIDEKGEPQTCPSKWVRGSVLEDIVWDTVSGLLQNPELLVNEVQKLGEPDSVTRENLEVELGHVRARLTCIPAEQKRLVEGYRKGLYADFMMREEMERIEEEKAHAERRLRELEQQLQRLDQASAYQHQVVELAARLSEGLETMGFGERQELLRLLVDEIIYDEPGELTIRTILPLVQLHPEPRGFR